MELDGQTVVVMVPAGGPYYGPLEEMDLEEAGRCARRPAVNITTGSAITNTVPALTGATYDIDGGQQFVSAS